MATPEIHYVSDVRVGGEWEPCREDDDALKFAEDNGAEEAWYWYSAGDYCGDGCIILRGEDGRWGVGGLSHCSCYGPFDEARVFWHPTLADLVAKEGSSDAAPLIAVIGERR